MQPQLPVQTLWRREQESGGQREAQTELCSRRSLVSPLIDPLMALHRKKLVTGLLEHVEEIQEMDDGYAFKFDWSENTIRRVADYILFEGRNSPQLTFTIAQQEALPDRYHRGGRCQRRAVCANRLSDQKGHEKLRSVP